MKKHLLILLSLFLAFSNLKAEYVLDAGTITSSDMTAGFFDDLWDTLEGHQFQLKLTGTVTAEFLNEFTEKLDMTLNVFNLENADVDFTSVSRTAFNAKTKFKSLILPEAVVSIDADFFNNDTNIESLYFNGIVTSFGATSLRATTNLKGVYLLNMNQTSNITTGSNWATRATFSFYVMKQAPVSKLTQLLLKTVLVYNEIVYAFDTDVFAYIQEIKCVVNGGDSIIVNSTSPSVSLAPGDHFKFKVTGNSRYMLIESISPVNVFTKVTDNVYETTATESMVLSMTFSQGVSVLVTVAPTEGGSIQLTNTSGNSVVNGDVVTAKHVLFAKLYPNKGYELDEFSTGSSTYSFANDVYQISVQDYGEIAIVATFKKKAAYVNELDLTTASLASATSIIISGTWNTTDFTTLRNKLGKQVLTSVEVDEDFFALDGTTLNSVFANCAVLEKADLRNLGTVGTSSLFTNCIKLRYINISEGITGSTNDFAGVTSNLLIYGTTECPTAWIGKNYIKNGTASSIVLEHGAPFYCPEAFTATEISYTRSFTKISGSGTAAGYESLVLPFTPDTYTTSGDRYLNPWDNYGEGENEIPFWLLSLSGNNYTEQREIEANVPYLVCFPNNSTMYPDKYNVNGDVTFSAQNATVAATNLNKFAGPNFSLTGTFEVLESGNAVYAMHESGEYFENESGRDIVPFEGFASALSNAQGARRLYVAGVPAGMDDFMRIDYDKSKFNVYTRSGDLVIDSEIEQTISIYTTTGSFVKKVEVLEGENVVSNLPKGVYIVSGKKVIL